MILLQNITRRRKKRKEAECYMKYQESICERCLKGKGSQGESSLDERGFQFEIRLDVMVTGAELRQEESKTISLVNKICNLTVAGLSQTNGTGHLSHLLRTKPVCI